MSGDPSLPVFGGREVQLPHFQRAADAQGECVKEAVKIQFINNVSNYPLGAGYVHLHLPKHYEEV